MIHSRSMSSQLHSSSQRCFGSKPLAPSRLLRPLRVSSSHGYTDFQKRASKWVAEQRLDKKAEQAGKAAESTLKNAYEQAQATARRTYTRLDSEYNLGDKASTAGRRVEETLRDVDQQWSVRRKLRSFSEYLQRNLPRWQAAASNFVATPGGKVSAVFLVLVVVQLPLFWRAINFLLLLWWASIPISLLLVGLAQRKQAQRMAEAQAQEERRQANPIGEMFRAAANAAKGGSSNSSSGGGGGRKTRPDGPIIDAEFTEVK